ncbi:uncharacterized protein LOC121377974 [Gigantopelta aegis]|uniref:uncharacterized protein LOC121377974 n=1 Tax=Gigantopelta aegis TaxID=1735272 RepID=UPI001B88B002|nr:uncharacterized protein LOC121377974 [Gigantopelta aegis]
MIPFPVLTLHENSAGLIDIATVSCTESDTAATPAIPNRPCKSCNLDSVKPNTPLATNVLGPFLVVRQFLNVDFHVYFSEGVNNAVLNFNTISSYLLTIKCTSTDPAVTASEILELDILPNLAPTITKYPGGKRRASTDMSCMCIQDSIVHLCSSSQRLAELCGLIDEVAVPGQKVVICTSDKSDVFNIQQLLSTRSVLSLAVHVGSEEHIKDQSVHQWNTMDHRESCVVLVTNDECLIDLAIVDATAVIHFGLPNSKTKFGARLACMKDYFYDMTSVDEVIKGADPTSTEATVKTIRDLRYSVYDTVLVKTNVSDGKLTTGPYTTTIRMINLNSRPQFTNLPVNLTIPENAVGGQTIIVVSYNDPDLFSTLAPVFTIDPVSEAYKFVYEQNSRRIKLATVPSGATLLDAENTQVYNISGLLNDGFLDSVGEYILLTVLNVNEPPVFNEELYYCSLVEPTVSSNYYC